MVQGQGLDKSTSAVTGGTMLLEHTEGPPPGTYRDLTSVLNSGNGKESVVTKEEPG